jgi:hypothetical protein
MESLESRFMNESRSLRIDASGAVELCSVVRER